MTRFITTSLKRVRGKGYRDEKSRKGGKRGDFERNPDRKLRTGRHESDEETIGSIHHDLASADFLLLGELIEQIVIGQRHLPFLDQNTTDLR